MSSVLVENAWMVSLFPLIGAIVVVLTGRRLKQHAHLPVVVAIAASFVYAITLLLTTSKGQDFIAFSWLSVGDSLKVPIEIRVDGLSTMMLSMVTFVATLVAIFAAGYMAGDPSYTRFFALFGLFVFSMTGLVLSGNYLLTYAFWEGVGVCSYLLIGFWHSKPAAAAAAKKAFLVNRIGDVGFALAIFWLWKIAPGHSLSYSSILSVETLSQVTDFDRTGIALLLFWAAAAKSAQFPLYVWLPDAMEGPTPVSALIHAATMVTAGVYLIARSSALIVGSPTAQLIICITGCVTALLAASIAITQNDLKRVMAYSTVSQLGFMFMALGAGVGSVAQIAIVAALFHLFTHAFFKALLFLASGSVMHAMGGVIDMRRFGGLRHRLPVTCATFAIGGLALAGIVPTAGFWSKDEILTALKMASSVSNEAGGTGWGRVYLTIYWVAILTAFMTAFYTGRAFFMTFWGVEKLPSPNDPEAEPEVNSILGHGHDDPGHGGHDSHVGHESPPIMTYPLMALAFCALFAGLVFGPTGWFEGQISSMIGFKALNLTEHHGEHGWDWLSIGAGTLAGVLGIGLSYLFYGNPSLIPGRITARIRPLYQLSLDKFRVDEIYDRIVIGPTMILTRIAAFFDTYIIDNLVRLVALMPRLLGRDLLAPYQNGLIQYYAAVTAFGVAGMLAILLLF